MVDDEPADVKIQQGQSIDYSQLHDVPANPWQQPPHQAGNILDLQQQVTHPPHSRMQPILQGQIPSQAQSTVLTQSDR